MSAGLPQAVALHVESQAAANSLAKRKSHWKTGLLWFLAADVVALALVVLGLQLTGIRLGLDVQKLIGEPACMPSLVYLWRKTDLTVTPKTGDYVVALMPKTGITAGARAGDRIVKKVMAVSGDRVRIEGTELWINEVHTDRLWLAKSLPGREVGDFDRDAVLGEGDVFLMGTTHESFDSRYWGPVKREAIIGYAVPLL